MSAAVPNPYLTADGARLRAEPAVLPPLARALAASAFRTDPAQPGFALVDLGETLTPLDFRRLLIDLAAALDAVYRQDFGRPLDFVSMSQFDQQVTTKPHLDGGPAESLLLLGYEPSAVASRLELVDFTRCALDHGRTPRQFLDEANPTFGPGAAMLRPYAVPLTAWRPKRYQVLLINNSTLGLDERDRGMLGLMHHAVIDRPDPTQARRVNSLMLTPVPPGTPPRFSAEQVREFVERLTPLAS
jgi:hypothetical protein